MSYKSVAAILCAASIVFSQISITGTVKDSATQAGIQGAVVSLAATGLTTVTDNNGKYSFGTSVSTAHLQSPDQAIPAPVISNNRLIFRVAEKASFVRIDLYTLSGRLVRTLLDKELTQGNYRLNLMTGPVASQPYLLKIRLEKNSTVLRLPLLDRTAHSAGTATKIELADMLFSTAKLSAAADTIMAWAVGYLSLIHI